MGVLGSLKLAYATTEGVGISPDSTIYLGGAKNLHDKGQFDHPYTDEPITHFPPLYSSILALISSLGLNSATTARLINLLIYFLTYILAAIIIFDITDRSINATLLGSLVIISANDMLWVHLWAWTEPIFILLGFSGLYALSKAIDFARFSWLFFSAVLVGLTLITRYAGIAFFISCIVSIGLFYSKKNKDKLKAILMFSIISLIPILFWILRNYFLSETATDREFQLHFITRDQLFQAAETVKGWFITYPVPDRVASITIDSVFLSLSIILIVLVSVSIFTNKGKSQSGKKFPVLGLILFIFFFAYFGFIIFSISFMDAYTPLNSRILVPAYFAIIPVIILILKRFSERLAPSKYAIKIFSTSIILLVSFIVFLNMIDQLSWVSKIHQIGLGYNNRIWKTSESVKFIASLPEDIHIISNAPDALYYLTGRSTIPIPSKFNPSTQQDNPDYYQDLESIQEIFVSQKARLVIFNNIYRDHLPTEEELLDRFHIVKTKTLSDGNLYSYEEGVEDE